MPNPKCIVAIAFAAALLLGSAPAAALADAQADVLATVHQFMDALNKGDVKTALAACAKTTAIIDDFAPHQWTSCGTWMSAFDADSKRNGITDGVVTLLEPWHVDVTGSRAYAVIPANYLYKQNGKPGGETGSVLTAVLQKLPAGWRITGWAWARH
jgi:hypothetical protein